MFDFFCYFKPLFLDRWCAQMRSRHFSLILIVTTDRDWPILRAPLSELCFMAFQQFNSPHFDFIYLKVSAALAMNPQAMKSLRQPVLSAKMEVYFRSKRAKRVERKITWKS